MIALKEKPVTTRSLKKPLTRAELRGRAESDCYLDDGQPPDISGDPAWTIKNILVPTDFSACSTQAVARGAALARRHEAKLTLLHVVDINASASWTHLGTAESLMSELWATGLSGLHGLAESLAESQTKTHTLIVEGLPAEAIVQNSIGFDLLVMGAGRDKSGWSWFSKQTARRVLEGAECPVLVCHPKAGLTSGKFESKASAAA